MEEKRITLRDIARVSGVSHMTVSRTIKDDPRVREETKKKIQNHINRLGFIPNVGTRNLFLKRTKLIGLEVPDISTPFCAELARGIEDKAYKEGYKVIFCSTDNDPGRLEFAINLMSEVGVDGYVITSARLQEPVIEKLLNQKLPVVLVNRKMRGERFNYVVLDNERGVYELMQHLLNLGYREIAIINGPLKVSTGLDRFKGYKKALKEYNIALNPDYVINGSWSRSLGYEGAKRLLKLKKRPEAIFGANDYIALGVIDAAEELGFRIPEDIALVGFDDTEFASNKRIGLTTVSQRKYEMGSLGIQILVDYIERKETNYVHKIVLEPRLVIRESCGYKLRTKRKRIEKINPAVHYVPRGKFNQKMPETMP